MPKKCDCVQTSTINNSNIDIAKLKVEFENLEKTVGIILKAIFGNGNPGLKTKLEQLLSALRIIKWLGGTTGPVALIISGIAIYLNLKGGI